MDRIDESKVFGISEALRFITQEIEKHTGEEPQYYGLGGMYGYGIEFENDTFMMHPFCWCEKEDCEWCKPCTCGPDSARYFQGDKEISCDEYWDELFDLRGTHELREVPLPENFCKNCKDQNSPKANFLFKPTGTEINWYKYIGRGMRGEGVELLPENWKQQVLDSLKAEKS